MNKRMVVFAPHPDDETLGCGGTIARKITEGYDVFVVFMTDGRNALSRKFNITMDPTPHRMKKIRKNEAGEAADVLGIRRENLFFLDFEDGNLTKSVREASAKVLDIMNRICPDEVFFPQRWEENPDHRGTHFIVETVIQKLRLEPTTYQYVIAWPIPLSLLTRFQIGLPLKLITSFSNLRLASFDISRFLFLKKLAIKQYRSQVNLISKAQKTPVVDGFMLKRFLQQDESFFTENQGST